MEEYLSWILNTIRDEKSLDNWLEEIRFDFARTTINTLKYIENGATVLVCSDNDNKWFVEYIISKINSNTDMPFLPFINFNNFFPHFEDLKSAEDKQLLIDMLDISFPSGYIFWYIGSNGSPYCKISGSKDHSLLWINNTDNPTNGLCFENDEFLDKHLIDSYNLLHKVILAKIYGEIIF